MSSVVVAMWILGFLTGVETIVLVMVLAKNYDLQQQFDRLRAKFEGRGYDSPPKGAIPPRMYKAPRPAQGGSGSQ